MNLNFLRLEAPVSDPVLLFAIVMVAILVAPITARRLHIPGLVGIILIGAVLGPHGINLLERDNTMILLGTVGLLYLLYQAGLSLDLVQFAKLRYRSVIFGLFSFCLPMAGAVSLGLHLLGYTWPQSLLLGSIVASHTLLAYPIVKRLSIGRNTAMITATGGTLLTDALSLSVLAGVVAAEHGEINTAFWIRFVTLIGGYVVLVVVLLPRLGRWFFRQVNDPLAQFVFMLAVLFTTAYASTLVGLAPIVGAFLAGLVMNRLIPENSTLMNRINFVGDSLFVPFFLISVGMLVDFSVLFGSGVLWYYVLVYSVLVIGGKALAAKITQWLFGQSPAEGWAMAGLSIPQAAATLAVTLVGYEMGLFNATEVNAVVVLILITCILGPLMVERYGKQIALAEETAPIRTSDAPRRIAVPLANPAAAESLMDTAFLIQESASRDPIYPLTVAPGGENIESQVAACERLLGYAVIHASAAGVPVIPVTRIDPHIPTGIERAFQELRIYTAIIGWDGKQSSRKYVFGGILDSLIARCTQQLLIARVTHPLNTTTRLVLLVPVFADREIGFDESMVVVKRLAAQLGVKLVICCTEGMQLRLQKRIKRIKPDLSALFEVIDGVASGPAALEPAINENDLLVLISARSGRISWQPALQQLPRRMVQQYPDTSLIVVYPSELDLESPSVMVSDPLEKLTATPWKMLTAQRVVLKHDAEDLDAVVEDLLLTQFKPKSMELGHALHALVESRSQVPIEVTPGVVLLHAHVPYVEAPTLFLATSAQGLKIDRIERQVYVVFILLSPTNLPPKRHLESLAGIAHLMHDATAAERIYKATDSQSLQDILNRIT